MKKNLKSFNNIAFCRDAERVHYLMQLGCYFTELMDQAGIRFASTSQLSDIWYTQAYDIQKGGTAPNTIIPRVEQYSRSRKRHPCIYVIVSPQSGWIDEALRAGNYAVFEEEAWMFARPKKVMGRSDKDVLVKQVRTDSELKVFTSLYRAGLPGPEVEKYIASVVEMFKHRPANTKFDYFYACYKGTPASMLSYHQMGTHGGIYAVATLPEFRKKGVVKALLAHTLDLAKRNGASTVFLQTVIGGDAETVFKRCGFKTRFTRRGYTTKKIIEKLTHG